MRTLSGMKQWIKAVRGPSAGSPSSCAATTTMWPNSGETFLYVGASQKHAWIHLSVLYFILTVPHSTLFPLVPYFFPVSSSEIISNNSYFIFLKADISQFTFT